jgi:hypothetical protein
MIKRLETLKNTVNKYMADIRPDRLTTCQSEQKSVESRRPTVHVIAIIILLTIQFIRYFNLLTQQLQEPITESVQV